MKERQSNIELLRIVSMFFIVLEHMLILGTHFFTDPIGNQAVAANSIIGFTYIGVNCFILISGYFCADFSWKRLLSIYLICLFYEVFGFIIAYVHGDVELSRTALGYILFPLSHSNNWFIRCYVILLLSLPILNAGLERLDVKQYLYALLLLTILNLYFGWFHKQTNFNGDGYNISQMVYLYVIGGYLNRYVDWDKIRPYKRYIFIGWVFMAILWGVVQNISTFVHIVPHWNGWAYNNPILILSAILFFAYFRLMDIPQIRTINLLSATMLGVFLIHMNRYMGDYIYNGVCKVICMPLICDKLWIQIAVLILLAIVGLMVMSACDIPRLIIHNRVLRRLCSHTHTHTHTHNGRR